MRGLQLLRAPRGTREGPRSATARGQDGETEARSRTAEPRSRGGPGLRGPPGHPAAWSGAGGLGACGVGKRRGLGAQAGRVSTDAPRTSIVLFSSDHKSGSEKYVVHKPALEGRALGVGEARVAAPRGPCESCSGPGLPGLASRFPRLITVTLAFPESQLPRLKNGAVKSSLQSSGVARVSVVRTALGTDPGTYTGVKTVIVIAV